MAGTAANYMAGALGIGVTTPLAPLQLGNGYTDANYDGYRATGSPSFLMAYGQTSVIHRILGGVYNQAGTVNLDLSLAITKDRGTAGSGFRITSGVGAGANASNSYLAFSSLTGAADETFTTTERMRIDAAGSLGIGAITINASARLQVDSTTQGFLPPRMTAAQRAAIASPATGLIVYQTDGVEGLWLRVSTGWVELTVV
jgi:hypothetical protein